jgi:hypothetical protein
MAEFRALAEFRAAGLAQGGRAGDTARTLVLSGPQERLGSRSAPRHRGRRRTTPAASWRVGTLIGAAATVVVLAAVVLAGTVPGPFHRHVSPSASTSSPSRDAGGNSSSPKVQGSATPEPTRPPSPSSSLTPQQAEAISLCNVAYGFVKGPRHSVSWRQDTSLIQQLLQLIDLAGGLGQVRGYCLPYVGDLFPTGIPKYFSHLPGSGGQGPGSSQVGQENQVGVSAHL